jgi:hypothetical protein
VFIISHTSYLTQTNITMSRLNLACAIMLMTTALTTNALAPSSATRSNVERRQMFGILGSVITGAAVMASVPQGANAIPSLKVGPASPFAGDYEDPNHPGCLRQVKVVGAPLRADGTRPNTPVMEITGYDGNGSSGNICTEADRPTRSDLWKIQGKVKSNSEVAIDFSPKGGPSNLIGTFDGDGIVFPDGNKWTKVPSTNNRRPKDMTTLQSNM